MIRVKVFPPPFCSFRALDERGWMELEDGAVLADVVKAVRMPALAARIMKPCINGLTAPLDTVLKDGDVIGFFSLVSGG